MRFRSSPISFAVGISLTAAKKVKCGTKGVSCRRLTRQQDTCSFSSEPNCCMPEEDGIFMQSSFPGTQSPYGCTSREAKGLTTSIHSLPPTPHPTGCHRTSCLRVFLYLDFCHRTSQVLPLCCCFSGDAVTLLGVLTASILLIHELSFFLTPTKDYKVSSPLIVGASCVVASYYYRIGQHPLRPFLFLLPHSSSSAK